MLCIICTLPAHYTKPESFTFLPTCLYIHQLYALDDHRQKKADSLVQKVSDVLLKL